MESKRAFASEDDSQSSLQQQKVRRFALLANFLESLAGLHSHGKGAIASSNSTPARVRVLSFHSNIRWFGSANARARASEFSANSFSFGSCQLIAERSFGVCAWLCVKASALASCWRANASMARPVRGRLARSTQVRQQHQMTLQICCARRAR